MRQTDIIILAAGKGTRMCSTLPKVLHKLASRSLLGHVLNATSTVDNAQTIVVTGHGAELVKSEVSDSGAVCVNQAQQLGTAHAVQCALPHLRDNARVLVLYGDVPLIDPRTIQTMVNTVSGTQMALLTVELDDPTGYGRIVRDDNENIEAIVEQKDATPEQLQINEVNTGVMALSGEHLKAWLSQIDNKNAQGEYYLTDLIAIARQQGITITSIKPLSATEVQGVNNRQQLSQLERAHQQKMAETLMDSGTSLADPQRFDQRGTLKSGTDNYIDINCIFEGDVTLGSNVHIGPNCYIINSLIGDGVQIKANSVIENAVIGDRAVVGPFARIRPDTQLAADTKVGNFVEIKKSTIGKGSKVNHLSYVGDAELGDGVNIGAGTITCNYDGVDKHKTEIGDNSFIGSNTTLVAPVSVSEDSFVGAGSTVTKDVEAESLAVARAKQRNIKGWTPPSKKRD